MKKSITKIFTILILCIGFSASSISVLGQNYPIDNNNGLIITTCSGTFTDSGNGGFGDYGNNENYSVTFCSGSADNLQFIFNPNENATGYALAAGDVLSLYDGIGVSGVLISLLTNTNDPGSNVLIINSLSSCVTFQFVSNSSVDDDGWEAFIQCVPAGCGTNPPAADNFADAPYLCNLDGFCGTTNGYTDDEPFNFIGGGNCPGPIFGGTIENNSWVNFQASGPNISFDIDVIGCYGPFGYDANPSASSYGIQAAILSFNTTTNIFTRVSDCALSDGQQLSMTLTNILPLVTGGNYYLVVDGSAGSICDYAISVSGNAQTFSANNDTSICAGNTANLSVNGPAGASYIWEAIGGGFGPSIGTSFSVSPTVTTTYTVEIVGSALCSSQTDSVTITVNNCSNPCNASQTMTWD
jgi:hypothetical protein